jgi:hypothetical protein
MKAKTCLAAVLMVHAALARADAVDPGNHGAYLSAAFGNGRIHGGNASGYRWMRGRTFEVRAGRQQDDAFGVALPPGWTLRVDFVHYNEGHPDNNHRDGFALQWLAVHRFSPMWTRSCSASAASSARPSRRPRSCRMGIGGSAARSARRSRIWPARMARMPA